MESYRKEVELLSKTKEEEKTILEREMTSLQDQLQTAKEQTAQVNIL